MVPIVVIDTETTGKDPLQDALVEFAAIRYINGHEVARMHTLINPGRPIPPTASAIHGLVDSDVCYSPRYSDVRDGILNITANAVIVAHNAPFDSAFLPDLKSKIWICNFRFARHLWPDAPEHKNQTLRYWLKVPVESREQHRAASDAEATAAVFFEGVRRFVELGYSRTVGALRRYVDRPIVYASLPFGKYKGQPLPNVDDGYLRWAHRSFEDADIRHTIEIELNRRRDQAA
jgi:DNA polymerase III epsilon subunit family exonuclease